MCPWLARTDCRAMKQLLAHRAGRKLNYMNTCHYSELARTPSEQCKLVLDSVCACVWLHLYIYYINVCEFYTRRPWAKFAPNYLHDVLRRCARTTRAWFFNAHMCVWRVECICEVYTTTYLYILSVLLLCGGLKWFNGSGESTTRTRAHRRCAIWIWANSP